MKKGFLAKARRDPPAAEERLQAKACDVLAMSVEGQFEEDSSDDDTTTLHPRGGNVTHDAAKSFGDATVVTQSTAGLSLGSFPRHHHMARDDDRSSRSIGGLSTTAASMPPPPDVHRMEEDEQVLQVPGGFAWMEDRRGGIPQVTTVEEDNDDAFGVFRQPTTTGVRTYHQRPASSLWPEGLSTGFATTDAGGGDHDGIRPTGAFATTDWSIPLPLPPPPPGFSPRQGRHDDDGWTSRCGLQIGGDDPTVVSTLTGSRLPMPAKQPTAFGEEPKASRPGGAVGDGRQVGVPKAALYSLYSKPPYRINLSADNYYCWNDGGPPHNMRFTCIFCCPHSGELFQSGRYGDDTSLYQYKDGLYWYVKKGLAEHGAAARAHDCLQYRSVPEGSLYSWVGDDSPYRKARSIEKPSSMTAAQWQKMVQAQIRAPHFHADAKEVPHSTSRVAPMETMPVAGEDEVEREVYGSKGALYTFYTKPPYRTNLTSDQYISWSDGGPAHDMRFTSLFICPWTGEVFPSGRLGGERVCQLKHGSWWYQKKTLAEHAAAARAHDCLHYRSVPEGSPFSRIGRDAPYRESLPFTRPPTMPHILWQNLEGVRSRAPHYGMPDRHWYDADAALEKELFG